MIKKIIFCFLFVLLFTSNSFAFEIKNDSLELPGIDKVINFASNLLGTKYKFGGMSPVGIDCSGMVFLAFKQLDIILPRSSHEIATLGINITFDDIKKGDLLFFKTRSNKRKIDHVALVVEKDSTDIKFIHATTKSGVIISSYKEKYWKKTFVKAQRIM